MIVRTMNPHRKQVNTATAPARVESYLRTIQTE
jgi:hypothetical protein